MNEAEYLMKNYGDRGGVNSNCNIQILYQVKQHKLKCRHWKTSVLVCPHVNEKPAFLKISSVESVFSDRFHRIRVDGRPDRRKN